MGLKPAIIAFVFATSLQVSSVYASSLPVLVPSNYQEYFNVGDQFGDGEAYNINNSITPMSYNYYAGSPINASFAIGELGVSGSPSPEITAHGQVSSPSYTNEVFSKQSASLTYQIELIGANGTVPVEVSAKGYTSVSGSHNIYTPPGDNYGQIQFGVNGNGVAINKSVLTELYDNTDGANLNFGGEYEFKANSVYTVQIAAATSALDYASENGSYSMSTAYIDPEFTINSAYREDYSLDISPGVGNNISVVPLPSSLPLFGVALLAFVIYGYGMKHKVAADIGA